MNKCIGVLFFYILFLDLVLSFLITPALESLMEFVLKSVPSQYISLDTLGMAVRHPLVLVVALLSLAVFCVACLVKASGIFLCLEAASQGKPVRFFRILPVSLRRIRHAARPKNWWIFVYLILVQPLINPQANAALLRLVVPEFIMDVINLNGFLSLLYAVAMLVAFLFFLRFLFLQQYFILEGKDFKEASRKSRDFPTLRKLTVNTMLLVTGVLGTLTFVALPMLVLIGGDMAIAFALKGYDAVYHANRMALNNFGYPFIETVGGICINLLVSAFLLTVYHSKEAGKPPVALPEALLKRSGKVRNFRFFRYAVTGAGILLTWVVFAGSTLLTEAVPAWKDFLMAPVTIIAHKGYSAKAPENTMAAFDLAAACEQVDLIELDVRETKDGVPVVIHNATVSDATGGADSRAIYDITLGELRTIPAPYHFGKDFADARIPTLEEVLAKHAGSKRFLIEIKMDASTPDLPAKIVALMEQYGCAETSMVQSGNYEDLKAVKAVNPAIRCGYIMVFGIGFYYDLPAADFFSVEHHTATPRMLAESALRGKPVYAWTVNSEETMKNLAMTAIDGVITDFPEQAHELVNKVETDPVNLLLLRETRELNGYAEAHTEEP